jgi:hypothetical protein
LSVGTARPGLPGVRPGVRPGIKRRLPRPYRYTRHTSAISYTCGRAHSVADDHLVHHAGALVAGQQMSGLGQGGFGSCGGGSTKKIRKCDWLRISWLQLPVL